MDTIAAIATPFGEGAVALLRLSGPAALSIAESVFRGRRAMATIPARRAEYGAIYDGARKLDDVLLTVFRAPASYTGEDVVEIGCHGGVLIARQLLEALLRAGARAAGPGEFTQRAYLNGKMDLTQAEAVMDLIRAQTDLAARAATEQLEGRLGAKIREMRGAILEVLAHLEAYIDFPDEDIDPDTGAAWLAKFDRISAEIDALLATAGQGKVLREGVRTVLFGAPNVGKSSLLNLLLGTERAIVSPRPGTTRDVIEEIINLRGIPLRLTDTAGIGDTSDELEQAGMERTLREVDRADLILQVVDGNAERSGVALRPDALVVLNKIDLGEHASWQGVEGIRISCLKNEGLDALAAAIEARLLGGHTAQRDWSVAINSRHQACLEGARGALVAAREAFTSGLSPEFVAEDVRSALNFIGDITGRADSEELLGVIFGRFCIGK